MNRQINNLFFLTLLAAAALVHADEAKNFTVDFNECSEFVGWGPVNKDKALSLLPKGMQPVINTDGNAGIVVRAAHCERISVAGGKPIAGSLSQIGINIISPDKTGDINNYTLIYISDNKSLVEKLQNVGAPAVFDPALIYEFTPENATNLAGELYVAAHPYAQPEYFLTGLASNPLPNSAIPFLANWWALSNKGLVKQATTIPKISFGNAPGVALHTSRNTYLGRLIGGNTDQAFTYLPIRGVFADGRMVVSLRR